ncbi:MAG: PIG-L family deacetylase [Aureliella sp.]
MNQPLPKVKSLLCIGAHADDIEIGCAGTLMRLVAEQPELKVTWCVFSASETRRTEALESANRVLRSVAQKTIEVFDFRDGYFPVDFQRIKDTLFSVRENSRPDMVLSHRREDAHQDHRLLGELSWQVFRDANIWEYEIPKYDCDLGHPNAYVSISEQIAASKCELLLDLFASQQEKPWFNEQTFRAMLTLRGLESHSASGLAEAFYVRKFTF